MKINKIDNTSFGRKPNMIEMKVYTRSLNRGLQLLDKQVDVIIHNVSAPSIHQENTGIGSLFSRTTAEKLIPFLKQHAISGIQMEPINMRKLGDTSPYSPQSSAKNVLMIPLEKLASDEYHNLLSKDTFASIVRNNPDRANTDYGYVNQAYEKAMREAYKNFKKGDFLQKEFVQFKEEKGQDLERAAIFRILDKLYLKNWTEWDGIDKNLYAPTNAEEVQQAQERIKKLKALYADEIDFFMFQQMILERENAISNALAKSSGVKMIGDSPVASPACDEWVNQNLFLKNMALGCPPDFFSSEGQRWGFKYFDPEKIFNEDGSLGEAGKVLQKKYEEYFASFPGGLRIDHVIGLIDPFLYTESERMMPHNSGRIFSEWPKYKKNDEQFKELFTKIIIPAAEKYGIDKSSIICEDLGERTLPTRKVMSDLDLSGIAVTQYDYRGSKTQPKDVIMLGSHDNMSFLEFIEHLFNDKFSKRFTKKTERLGEDTAPSGSSIEKIEEIINDIRNDKKKFLDASFAELFTSPARRIQIFFTDFWGIPKTYNRPGTTQGNWSLRIGEDFEDDYYQAVKEGKAPNLAKAVATALRQRGLDKDNEQVMIGLDGAAKILEEP